MQKDPPKINQPGSRAGHDSIEVEGQRPSGGGGGGKYTTSTNGYSSGLHIHPSFTEEAENPFVLLQGDNNKFSQLYNLESKNTPDSSIQPHAWMKTPLLPFEPAVIPVAPDSYIVDHAVYYSGKQGGMNKTAKKGLREFGQAAKVFPETAGAFVPELPSHASMRAVGGYMKNYTEATLGTNAHLLSMVAQRQFAEKQTQ